MADAIAVYQPLSPGTGVHPAPPSGESVTVTTDGAGGGPKRRKRRKRARSPCVECNSVPANALEASEYEWCEDVEGKLCRGCGSFCERCMETRLRDRVTWREDAAHDGAFSTCDECWELEDEYGPLSDEESNEEESDEEESDGEESDEEETDEEEREEAAGATLVCAMRRSAFFENTTAKLHAVDAVFGNQAAAEFAADFGCG